MVASMPKSAVAARYCCGLGFDPVLPGRFGPTLGLAVDLDVDALVEEAQAAGDQVDRTQRTVVVPDQVLDGLAAGNAHRVIVGGALIRAAGHGVRGLELDRDVLGRQVPTSGQI